MKFGKQEFLDETLKVIHDQARVTQFLTPILREISRARKLTPEEEMLFSLIGAARYQRAAIEAASMMFSPEEAQAIVKWVNDHADETMEKKRATFDLLRAALGGKCDCPVCASQPIDASAEPTEKIEVEKVDPGDLPLVD